MILDLEIPHDDTWLLLWCELNDHIPYNRDLWGGEGRGGEGVVRGGEREGEGGKE